MKVQNDKNCESKIPFTNDGRYTVEMYRGNVPAAKGGMYRIDPGGELVRSDRYRCRFGEGEVIQGKVMTGSFSLNLKVTIYISYGTLHVTDFRNSGTPDVWIYCSDPEKSRKCLFAKHHDLEPEKLKEILNADVEDCEFWEIFKRTAREIAGGTNDAR